MACTLEVLEFMPNDGQLDFLNLNPKFPQAVVRLSKSSTRVVFCTIGQNALVANRKYIDCAIVTVPFGTVIPTGLVDFSIENVHHKGKTLSNLVYPVASDDENGNQPADNSLSDGRTKEQLLQQLSDLYYRESKIKDQIRNIESILDHIETS